jgi:beta-glucosidase
MVTGWGWGEESDMHKFPIDFLWGAATAAHQVEGGNINSDWWRWEQQGGGREPSNEACRHYQLYKEDFSLAAGLNHNAHRLSVEWSRIEPREGEFCEKELAHYKQVISALRGLNIEPVVTLHHFTSPAWFADKGGWADSSSSKYFLRFVRKVVELFSTDVRFWVTINEPMVYVYHSYLLGLWPPQVKSFLKTYRVADNMVTAHIKAYRLIHDIYKKKGLPQVMVSLAINYQVFQPHTNSFKDRLAVYLRDRLFNISLINKLIKSRSLDYLGINYYTRGLVHVSGFMPYNLLLDNCPDGSSKLEKNDLGWDIYPQGLYQLLVRLKRYNLPVFILENGICTADDALRWDFIQGHLKYLSLAMKEGVKVLGYLYWSLLDNFEWDKGFTPRFGLVEVDYRNYKRTVRESAVKFAAVCKSGILENG